MRILISMLLSFIVCCNVLAAAGFEFTGNTSVYGLGYVDNQDYPSSAEHDQTDVYAAQDVSLGFFSDKAFRAQCDASLYGSVFKLTQDLQSYSRAFTLDINQIYVEFPMNDIATLFAGKKVVTIGLSSNFSLVNRVNARYQDPIRGVITQGTGVLGETMTALPWVSFTGLAFFNSRDANANYEDINFMICTDFFWKAFTFSIYSYFERPFSVNVDWGNLANSNPGSLKFPAAFTGSAQLGSFTLYTELLIDMTEAKYAVTGANGNYTDDLVNGNDSVYRAYSFGVRYVSTELRTELEYEYNPSFYSAEESDSLYAYITNLSSEPDKETVGSIVHRVDGQYYRNNAAFSISYNPSFLSDFTFSARNLISFPSYGCSTQYIGDKVTCGISFEKERSFLASINVGVGFGGDKSEFVLFDKNRVSVIARVAVFY